MQYHFRKTVYPQTCVPLQGQPVKINKQTKIFLLKKCKDFVSIFQLTNYFLVDFSEISELCFYKKRSANLAQCRKQTARRGPLLRGDHQVSHSLHGSFCMKLSEAAGDRLAAPPHHCCMDFSVGHGGALLPFLLVHFSLSLLLNLYLGDGGWGRGLSRWGI